MIATSPGAPTCKVPSLGTRLMIFAGFIVAMATTARRIAGNCVQVRRDRIGPASTRERHFRNGVVEATAAMPNVEDHAAPFRGQRRRQQFPVLHYIGEGTGYVRGARISMCEDVARPQQVEDLRHKLAGLDVANVAHDFRRRSGSLARQDRALERLGPVLWR